MNKCIHNSLNVRTLVEGDCKTGSNSLVSESSGISSFSFVSSTLFSLVCCKLVSGLESRHEFCSGISSWTKCSDGL